MGRSVPANRDKSLAGGFLFQVLRNRLKIVRRQGVDIFRSEGFEIGFEVDGSDLTQVVLGIQRLNPRDLCDTVLNVVGSGDTSSVELGGARTPRWNLQLI